MREEAADGVTFCFDIILKIILLSYFLKAARIQEQETVSLLLALSVFPAYALKFSLLVKLQDLFTVWFP